MATKVIIRYKPDSPLVGRRELSPADFRSLGIFTQKKMLQFDKERNWWLDAEAAEVSKEALQWFEDSPEFTVERQEVDGDEDPEALRYQEAYRASLASPAQPSATQETVEAARLGEATATTDTTTPSSTTTQSTGTSKR